MQALIGFFDNVKLAIQNVVISDIIDILIVAFLIFQLINIVRSTRTAQVGKGIILLLLIALVSGIARLNTLNYILSMILELGFIALVIMFQPELRRALEKVGGVGGAAGSNIPKNEMEKVVRATVSACEVMSKEKIGMLLVFERKDSLEEYFKTGTKIDALTTEQLLRNLFFPKAALHDGAVIIRGGRTAAAGCVMPLSNNPNLNSDLGTRHRAGIGTSEVSDAVVVIVSEETGTISVAVGGMLKRHLAPQTLEKLLTAELVPTEDVQKNKFHKLFKSVRKLLSNKSSDKKRWLQSLVAVVGALCLWVYIVTVENPVKEIEINNIPVSFTGAELLREDYDLLMTESNVSGGVSLTFSGKLSDLNKLLENKSDLCVNVDITHLRNAQDYQISYNLTDITLPSGVSSQDVSLDSKSPSSVSLTLEQLLSVPVPVKIQQNISLEESYMSGRLSQNYTEVVVEAPAEIVKKISYAQAIFDRENVDRTITATLPLTFIDFDGEIIEDDDLSCEVTEVEVSLPVLMYKDVPLEVPIIYGGGITESDVVVTPTPNKIRLAGEPAVMEALQSIKLSNIDVSSMLTNSETFVKEILIPDGVNNVSGEAEASVSIEIKNKAIRVFRVSSSNFQFIGLPTDMVPNSRTTVLQVTIRANEADIDQITDDNIRVVADFTDITNLSKNMTMPVQIIVDGFEGAGVIAEAEYSILVDVVSADELEQE